MSSSDLITPQHLARKAIIYIRQSTPHQVLSNQESLRLQYALDQRAQSLGWHPQHIEIIDTDLGLTATAVPHRAGFKDLIAQVTLGQVGIILSYEVTRLSRNCSDWYPLLDLCAFKRCLIADRDGIYDPGSPNGRLLLGLKGQLSEMELHTIRARMTAGLLNKAERGELALPLPVGLVRDPRSGVLKDPHREVQARLDLVFTTFLRLRTASKVLLFLNEHGLEMPRRDRFGDLVWKRPTIAMVLATLQNPAYAGAFVYGRTRSVPRENSPVQTTQKRLPIDQWRIRVNDVYPSYISWATFEQIQTMLQDNYAEYDRNKSRGVPRPGSALLHGIVYCGECGHKLVVQYKRGTRYLCNYLRQQYRVPVCQNLPADPIDRWVVATFFEALSPVDLDVYAQAVASQEATHKQLARAQHQHLERLRYHARLAERQFNRVDPDNRLVAAELETRWEAALADLRRAEAETERHAQEPVGLPVLPKEVQAAFSNIGQHLPQLWQQEQLTQVQKKALLRCLIDKVVIQKVGRDRVRTRIVWKGGETTTREVLIPVGSVTDLAGATEMEQLILELSVKGVADEVIAEHLTTLGHRSPLRPSVLPSTVRTIRLKHRIFRTRSQSHPRRVRGFLSVSQIAEVVGVTPHWIYDRIYNGTIEVRKEPQRKVFLFPDTPETLAQFHALKIGTRRTITFARPASQLD
jgi:DNA invertase Pin-like site-specific DNA recombinase